MLTIDIHKVIYFQNNQDSKVYLMNQIETL